LRSNSKRRVQRGRRALQDDTDFAAANRAQLVLRHLQQVFALEHHFALNLGALKMQQTQNRQYQTALSGSTISDQADDFASVNVQRKIPQDRGVIPIGDGQPERQEWVRQSHFLTSISIGGPSRRVSAFQNPCGLSTTGAEPTTEDDTATSTSLLIR